MSKTFEMIQKTLNDIEKTSVKMESKPKTAEEIKNILLNIDGTKVQNEVCVTSESNFNTQSTECPEFYLDMEELKKHKDSCNQQYSVPYFRGILPSRRRFNKPIIFAKRVIRKLCRSLIEPMVELQNNFNASVVRTINSLYNNELVTQEFMSSQFEANLQLNALLQEQKEMKSEIEELRSMNAELIKKIEEINASVEQLHRQADDFVDKGSMGNLLKDNVKTEETSNYYGDLDYFDFEKLFRGTQNAVKERLKGYVKYFSMSNNVVDLGCGRGEFLELMKDNKIKATGVDNYSDFVTYCIKKKLNVVEDDAVSYLEKLDEESVDGIFAAQLVEHLPIDKLIALCQEAYKKLQQGGVLIMETPNPTNLAIFMNSFYLDPTHKNPIHPKTLEYMLKKAGFGEIDIIFTEDSKINYRLPLLNADRVENLSEFNNGINLLSDMFFGSQDYAVIARK